jgi:alkaline phosphatase
MKNLKIIGLLIVLINNILVSQFNCPKNIILMIGDGMGENQAVVTSMFLYGTSNGLEFQKFPKILYMSTYPAKIKNNQKFSLYYNSERAYKDFNYLLEYYTDSAPAATAMSSGVKSYDGAIGVDLDSLPVEHLIQFAKRKGYSCGVVTSVPLSHATPAGFIANNVSRNNYEQIANQMFDSDLDLIIGCGHPEYDNNGDLTSKTNYKYVGGKETWEKIINGQTKWKFIENKEDFKKFSEGNAPSNLLGIPKVFETLQVNRDKKNKELKPYDTPLNSNLPDLATLSLVALNSLHNKKNGFFVMIEGGAIDWACHSNDTVRLIEETIDFNNAVKSVIEWVERNSNWDETLLIVTGDHETGYITGPKDNDNNKLTNPIINNGKGNIPSFKFNHKNHSNSLVPIYMKGVGVEIFELLADEVDIINGKYINNTEISIALKILLNFKKN